MMKNDKYQTLDAKATIDILCWSIQIRLSV